jgi:hypothetical protein
VGSGVTSLLPSVFNNCNSLTQIDVKADNTAYSSLDGVLFNKDKTNLVRFPEGKTGTYTVPGGVLTIGVNAFLRCEVLEQVVISDTVLTMGENAFAWCSNLTAAKIGNHVNTIGSWAFYNCTSLLEINIPDSVTTLNRSIFLDCRALQSAGLGKGIKDLPFEMFASCISLKSIVIPDNVETMQESVFLNCQSLQSVVLGKNLPVVGNSAFCGCSVLESIDIPDSVTSIEGSAFYGCTKLKNLKLGGGVTSIKWTAFTYCNSLESVEIPDSVTFIDGWAFADCISLQRVKLGSGVTTLGPRVFSRCSALKTLVFEGDRPANVDAEFLFDINPGSKVYYQPEASGWPESGSYWYGMQVFEWMPPVIVSQPVSQTALQGNRGALSVAATSIKPLQYQWMKDGVQIPNANESTYLFKSVMPSDAGGYTVEVSCESGYVLSEPAILTVTPQDAWLSFDRVEGKLILTFAGSLQESDDGLSWSESLEVLSPCEVNISGSKKFYRSTLVRP